MNVSTRDVEDTRLSRSGESRRRAVAQRVRLFAGAMFGLATGTMVSLSGMSCGSVNFGTPSGGPNDAGELDGNPTVGPVLVQFNSNAQCFAASAVSGCSGMPAKISLSRPARGNLLILSVADNGDMALPPSAKNLMFQPLVASTDQAAAEIWYGVVPEDVEENLEVTLDAARPPKGSSMDIEYIRLLAMEWHGIATGADLVDGSGKNSAIIDSADGGPASAPIVTKNANDLILFNVSINGTGFKELPGWAMVRTTFMTGPAIAEQVWYRVTSTTVDEAPTVNAYGKGWDAVIAAFKIAE